MKNLIISVACSVGLLLAGSQASAAPMHGEIGPAKVHPTFAPNKTVTKTVIVTSDRRDRPWDGDRRHHRHHDRDNDSLRYVAPLLLEGVLRATDRDRERVYVGSRECRVYFRGKFRYGTYSRRSDRCYIEYHGRTIGFSDFRRY